MNKKTPYGIFKAKIDYFGLHQTNFDFINP